LEHLIVLALENNTSLTVNLVDGCCPASILLNVLNDKGVFYLLQSALVRLEPKSCFVAIE
jgi:hypothetical protein